MVDEEVKDKPLDEGVDEDTEGKEEDGEEKEGDFSFNLNLAPKTKKILFGIVVLAVIIFGGMYYLKGSSSPEEISDPIVASINGQTLFLSQLDEAYMNINLNEGTAASKEEVLDILVDQILLNQLVGSIGLTATEAEVEAYIGSQLEARNLPAEVFYERAAENGISKLELNQMFKEQLLLEKFYEDQIYSKIVITEEMKQTFYDQNQEMFLLPDAVNVSHILVETEEEAVDVKVQLNDGVEMAELASLSIDPSAIENNGNIGFIVKGQTVPEFETAAFSLAEGEISDPVQTSYGYHIVEVNGIEPSRYLTYEETTEIVDQLLYNKRKQELIQQAIDIVEEQSVIELKLDVLE